MGNLLIVLAEIMEVADAINWLRFDVVRVLDVHSNVGAALLNNVLVCTPEKYLKEVIDADYVCGSFTKTVCEAKNKNQLLKAKTIAEELGLVEDIDYGCIYDKCLTELEPEEDNGTTLTGMWFCPLDDEVAHKISKKYQLYK